ncbi:MAG: RimK family protein [Porticoccaceae bacterium]|jgi:glutathione synthase/RimK-type ligase-like ATP-grasp enzyme|nr:RimK family protein [Porticoccaceae bacterium]HLS97931.1 RimK family protein [Porticoccaceae bacterium]
MTQTLLIVDDMADWESYYPSEHVMLFADYLEGNRLTTDERVRVINLCRSFKYLSDGYYCSLLAEARGHHVIPSVKVLNDLGKRALYQIQLEDISTELGDTLKSHPPSEEIEILTYFGTSAQPEYRELARRLFDLFPCPILEVTLRFRKRWEIAGLKARSHTGLSDSEETEFANALNGYSHQIWRKSRARKVFQFDMAILVNPEEAMPPSDAKALKKFIKAGAELGIDVELIGPRDYNRIVEYDSLFIRETTAIDHHTYRFAKKAEAEGLVVVDDPNSILRCTNKIFLADMFRKARVPAPRTRILRRDNAAQLDEVEAEFGYPIVIKIPDGAFSRGVVKVANRQELEEKTRDLFHKTALLLAQEFLYTDFDWRIGVFNNKAIYACRYYMVKNHWQIYRHGGSKVDSGGFDTLPTFEVPKGVLDAAVAATRPIGDGLYGVDVKERNGKGFVIEVNDNPNIDRGIEDRYLGDQLYHLIMAEFLRRMRARRDS